ncbi:MAG: hypothetical protein ACOCVZ_08330 [Gemmatimonadota bacterium]
MSIRRASPALPPDRPRHFFATVHGTVFGERSGRVDALEAGDELVLLPDPPVQEDPGVWVHGRNGDLIGHLPPEIEVWLGPWLLRGGRARARAVRVSGADVPSWRRLLIEVHCG